jgi:hypothetical protein
LGKQLPAVSGNYSGDGYDFTVTDSKLSFTLNTPTGSPPSVSGINGQSSDAVFGRTDSGYEVTFSPGSTNALVISNFLVGGANSYSVSRYAYETDSSTYVHEITIFYIYVDNNCTFSRLGKTWTEGGASRTYGEFNIALEAGWNLVQLQVNMPTTQQSNDRTFSLKIADKNVPWTVNGNGNTDQKSVTINGITSLSGQAGILLFAELPQGNNFPQMTAVRYGTISGGLLSLALTVPNDNTWENPSNPWTGNGDFYVAIMPVENNQIQAEETLIFVNGGNAPVKVTFDNALTTLDFGKFKKYLDL